MTKRANGQQQSAVGGKRRINVPSQPALYQGIRRLLRRRHLFDGVSGQNAFAINQRLGVECEIARGGEQAGVSDHSSHALRCRVLHRSAQNLALADGKRFRNVVPPRHWRLEPRVLHSQRLKNVRIGVLLQRHAGEPLYNLS